MIKINLPENVKYILHTLNNNGYEAYVVGGCVRDAVIDREPHDWDITTSAKPQEVMEVFKNFDVIPTGLEHGTVTVIIDDEFKTEITTFRLDGKYSDGRRPDNVEFTSDIVEDLKRRDFTINAMAYNDEDGLIDPFNGRKDIKDKIIRCVGNPYDRFNEDGLRILRAIRFAAKLEFDIDDATSDAIHELRHLLDNISKERIQGELCKILSSYNCGCKLLARYNDVIKMFVNIRINFSHRLIMSNFGSLPSDEIGDDVITRLALLFDRACYDSKFTYSNLKELKFSNEIIGYTTQLISYCGVDIPTNKPEIKLLMNKLNNKQMRRLIFLKKCMASLTEKSSPSIVQNILKSETLFNEVLNNNECYNLKQLAVNGDDLIEFGLPQGKHIGELLDYLLNLVIMGDIENKKEKLLKYIKENKY